ncbi:MAG: DMT family transporter, partial [Bacillota bacterium]
LTVKKVMAMIGSVTGCALVSGVLSNVMADISMKGLIFGVFAAVGCAAYGILARIMVKKYHPHTILFYTFLIAGAGGIFISDIGGILHIIGNEPISLGVIVIAAFICNVIPCNLYTTALKHIEASKASVFASIEPVVATMLGAVLFHESVTVSNVLGILCVLLAIGILNNESKPIEERLGNEG